LVEALNPLPSNPQESYVYDSVGNRTTSNQNGTSSFNQANEQLDDATFTYQYDNNGNMTRKTAKAGGAVTTYEYDAENKLVRVVSPTNTANYRYDGLGRRVEKEVIAGTTVVTRYVYDNEDILLELNGSNAIAARYTHGPGIDEPLIMEKAGASFYYHADGLGSITDITNQSGGVIQRYTYSSFGEIESRFDSNFVQPYTFTAREFDPETGLYHYRARQYDWRTGRFTTIDPLGFDSGSINLYSYVGNNPTNYTDPLGLFQWYGKWGGPGYTGGQNGSWNEIDPSKALPPIDKQDECYRQHDVCYGNCRDGSPCSSIRPPNCPAADQRAGCFKDCDRKLSKCLTALRGDPSNNLSAIIAARLFARTNPASDCAR
jgi:RHS repeat-associated protein